MAVEATTISVAWWDDPNYDGYWEFDRMFEDIHEVLANSETEFDRWNF